MTKETYFELEKVRFHKFDTDKVTVIDKSQDLRSLVTKAKTVQIKDGKTYGEKVRIVERDSETDDVIHYPYIRYVSDPRETY